MCIVCNVKKIISIHICAIFSLDWTVHVKQVYKKITEKSEHLLDLSSCVLFFPGRCQEHSVFFFIKTNKTECYKHNSNRKE